MRVIAKLEVKQNSVIKGLQHEGIYKIGNAEEIAKKYYKEGIDEIFLINNTGTLYQTKIDTSLIYKIRKNKIIPIACGGGIKNLSDAKELIKNGADKVVINSLFSEDKEEVKKIINEFGSSSVVGSIQYQKINDKFVTLKKMAREIAFQSLTQTLDLYAEIGVGELILNDVSRDGLICGFSKNILNKVKPYRSCFPLLFSGGFKDFRDIDLIKDLASGVVISSALHKNKTKIKNLKTYINKSAK